MAILYPFGYGDWAARVTLDTLFEKETVRKLHPEYRRRLKSLLVKGGGRFGIGTGWRSSDVQKSIFLARHYKVASGGCCRYGNARYQLKKGVAHAAPPGSSFHEAVVHGWASAIDAIGDINWLAQNCEAYGLEQATWGNEDWHYQFTEFPHSVTQWRAAGQPAPKTWSIPGVQPPVGPPTTGWAAAGAKMSTPPGTPTLRRTVQHSNVPWLQAVMCSMPKPPADGGKPIYPPTRVTSDRIGAGPVDGDLFGDLTYEAVRYWQSKNALTADGIYGPQTAAKLTTVRGK
jgi:hypothetical protein